MIVSDNVTVMTSHAELAWCQDAGIEWHHIVPGLPVQTVILKNINERYRGEYFNVNLFPNLYDLRPDTLSFLRGI